MSKTESKTPPPSPPSSVAAVPVATDQREKIDKTFTRFWTTAVKPTGYGKARDAFAAVYAAAPEMIPTVLAAWEQANEAWATWIDRDPNQAQYIPLPATWLQGQGWNDTVLRREREVSKIERLNQIGAALEGMDPDEALNQLLGLPDPVAVGELLPGSPTGDTAPAPTDRRIDDPVDAQLVADTTKGTTVATSQQIKTDWLDRARPLGHPDLDEYDRLADQLTADDAVDATAVRVAVKDCTGPTSRHARDRMLTALRDLAAQAVAS